MTGKPKNPRGRPRKFPLGPPTPDPAYPRAKKMKPEPEPEPKPVLVPEPQPEPAPPPPPPPLSPEELEKLQLSAILSVCLSSTEATAKLFFPERFTRPFSPSHREIFKLLDDDNIKQLVIAAPRGWGKTSMFDLAYPARNVLFRQRRVILVISSSFDRAVMQTENLKAKLLGHPLVPSLFGQIRPPDDTGITFSQSKWTTAGGVTIIPLGAGQSPRGILIGDSRPDLVIIDDLEDPESVRNEELRKRLWNWLWEDIMGLFDLSNPRNKLVVVGTVLHEDGILSRLMRTESFTKLRIELCGDDYKSNWVDYLTDDQVRAMAARFEASGRLDSFYREYRNLPIATETAHFSRSMFQYFEEKDIGKGVETVIIMDPAKTVSANADYTAIVGVGIDYDKPAIYVRDLIMKRLYPDQMVSEAFAMADRLGAKVVGVEVTSLNEFITHPIEEEMIRRGRHYQIVHLKARAKKEDRIGALSPYYRRRVVYHNPVCCEPLEAQLVSYPMSQHDDAMDALAYIIEMKALGDRFFTASADAMAMEEKRLRTSGDLTLNPLPDRELDDSLDWGEILMEVQG